MQTAEVLLMPCGELAAVPGGPRMGSCAPTEHTSGLHLDGLDAGSHKIFASLLMNSRRAEARQMAMSNARQTKSTKVSKNWWGRLG